MIITTVMIIRVKQAEWILLSETLSMTTTAKTFQRKSRVQWDSSKKMHIILAVFCMAIRLPKAISTKWSSTKKPPKLYAECLRRLYLERQPHKWQKDLMMTGFQLQVNTKGYAIRNLKIINGRICESTR